MLFVNLDGTLINLAQVMRVDFVGTDTFIVLANGEDVAVGGDYRDYIMRVAGARLKAPPSSGPPNEQVLEIQRALRRGEVPAFTVLPGGAEREPPATEPQRSGSPDAWR